MPDTRTMKMESADASPASAFDAERHPASAELEAREAPRDRDSEARESPQTSAVEPAASPPRRESTPEQRRRRALPFIVTAIAVQAQHQQAQANLAQARVNLERTEIRSPVNGWVTNLLAQRGDYVNVGSNVVSLVDADSFWIDGYFEETTLAGIREGDPASI